MPKLSYKNDEPGLIPIPSGQVAQFHVAKKEAPNHSTLLDERPEPVTQQFAPVYQQLNQAVAEKCIVREHHPHHFWSSYRTTGVKNGLTLQSFVAAVQPKINELVSEGGHAEPQAEQVEMADYIQVVIQAMLTNSREVVRTRGDRCRQGTVISLSMLSAITGVVGLALAEKDAVQLMAAMMIVCGGILVVMMLCGEMKGCMAMPLRRIHPEGIGTQPLALDSDLSQVGTHEARQFDPQVLAVYIALQLLPDEEKASKLAGLRQQRLQQTDPLDSTTTVVLVP